MKLALLRGLLAGFAFILYFGAPAPAAAPSESTPTIAARGAEAGQTATPESGDPGSDDSGDEGESDDDSD
jgi:hypothetical protein